MTNHHISEVIDIEALGGLFQHLSNLTDIATAVLDLDGNILIATKWQDICKNFHRINPDTAARCAESDTILAGQLEAGQKYNVYRCKNGLIDIAVPIVVDNVHVGNLFIGQFFFETPDFHYFEQQALEFDFDRETYLEALSRVPVFTREDIEQTMSLLCKMAQVIGEMGLNKLHLIDTNRELLGANAQLQKEISEREQTEQSLRESEEKYRILYNSSRDAIMIAIPGGRFIDGNPSALQLFGCQDKNEFISKTPADLFREYQPDGVLSSARAKEMMALAMERGSH
jgi:ligand-binding sensor protein